MENTKSEASKNDKKKAGPINANTNSKSQLFHAGKLEALQADVAILQALLRRNRCNHGRAKYYQRLSMAITAIKRSKALDLYSSFKALKREILATAKRKEVQRQRQLVFWEIQTTTANNNNNTNNEERQSQMQKLISIQETLEALPSILERLEFAAASLWVEMARGFFLPFCVTAVAAVARVRWLLRQAGLWILLPGESPSSTSIEDDEWTIVERAWQKAHYQQQETTLAETTSLWPRSQRNELRDILHASRSPSEMAASGPSSTTRTSTRLTLQRLGLEAMGADNNAAKSVSGTATAATNDSMDDTNTSINDTTDNDNAQGEEEITKTMVGQNVVDHDDDDDDTGVAVGGYAFMARAATGEDLVFSAAAAMEQTLQQRGGDGGDDGNDGNNAHHQEFDQNMDLVKEFKKNRSTKKQKKQKRGGDDDNDAQQKKQQRKRAAVGSDPESIDKSSKKKKQKKKDSKKKQKGDFFDELFG